MIKPTTESEQLLFTTVRIEVIKANKQKSIGTGFFFAFNPETEKSPIYIITNKHVVEDGITGIFSLHEPNPSAEPVIPSGNFCNVQIDNLQDYCIPHPDKDIDLVAISTAPLNLEAERMGKDIFHFTFDQTMIPNDDQLEELSAVEDILMAGYPIGLWDYYNNLPIIRRGITASHPAMDFCGKSITVIDAACFPGSSGSPVLIFKEGMYQTKKGLMMGKRILLLGVLYGGPQMTVEGDIEIKNIPTVKQQISETSIPIHLGYVIKAKEILKLINKARKS
ncbi:MAG: hypothetical protein STSR0009_15370 [Methanoregula sp.]